MRHLTQEQAVVFWEYVNTIYPPDLLRRLVADRLVATWWSGRVQKVRAVMLAIDRDQARSRAGLSTQWVVR